MPGIVSPLPCRRPELVSQPFGEDGSYLVRDRRHGEAFHLGPEEHFLLAHLDGARTAPDLCAAFAERFGEPLTEEHLQEFLDLASDRGLLQPGGAPVPARLPANGFGGGDASAPPVRRSRRGGVGSRLLGASAGLLEGLGALLLRAAEKLQRARLMRHDYVPRPDDVFIVTYPRSGTTWMQMILYQLTTDGSMDIPHIAEFCPWFERSERSALGFESRPSPRIFKTHLPYPQIPRGPCRYIYVARDGKDVAVSNYHLHRVYFQYEGTFAEFFDRFMRGRIGYGSWFDHVAGWWAHRNDPNVLFLTYEELSRDLEGCLRKIVAFCGFRVPEERFPGILERSSFDFMKKHESRFDPAMEWLWERGVRLNSFIRSGRVGEGAVCLDRGQEDRFEQAYRRRLAGTGVGSPGE